jgi:hypothetical protein
MILTGLKSTLQQAAGLALAVSVQGIKGPRIRVNYLRIINALKNDTREVERMLKAQINSLGNKRLNP